MKTLQVQNGDIQLDSGGRLLFRRGSDKLVQDLTLWLKEPYGTSFTAPSYGSTLVSMIGSSMDSGTTALVQSEVTRILNLYQSQQILSLQTAQNLSQLSNWNKSEIIGSINSVSVSQYYTSVIVEIVLTTLANTSVSFAININENGIQVTNNG